MLSGITILCFGASYGVALVLEISRLLQRYSVRIGVIAMMAAGLFAHSAFVWFQTQSELAAGIAAPLSSWFDWCILASWVLAAAYLALYLRRPQNSLGLFFLPPVLLLILLAQGFRNVPPFARDDALAYWGAAHGVALLLGTVGVLAASAAGVMYLVQSYRLKHKLPPRQGLKLPSLEWLQRFNRRTLLAATILLAGGLLTGVVLNLIKRAGNEAGVPWTDGVVVSSGVLFLWLVAAMLFEAFYKPARQGQKIAYLTVASFIFLGMALAFVLWGEHAAREQSRKTTSVDVVNGASCPSSASTSRSRVPGHEKGAA